MVTRIEASLARRLYCAGITEQKTGCYFFFVPGFFFFLSWPFLPVLALPLSDFLFKIIWHFLL